MTLFTVHFAMYLREKYKAKVAVAELAGGGIYKKASSGRFWSDLNPASNLMNGDSGIYFFNDVNGVLNGLNPERYDFIIYDLGIKLLKNRKIFDVCDQKIVIGSSLDWRRCEFEQFVSYVSHIDNFDKWEYLDVSGQKNKTVFVGKRKIKLKKVPWVENLYDLTENRKRLYESLL